MEYRLAGFKSNVTLKYRYIYAFASGIDTAIVRLNKLAGYSSMKIRIADWRLPIADFGECP